MRRIARLDRSIDLLRLQLSTQAQKPYLCSTCKYQSTAFSTSTLRAARDKVPITEKVRRRIWGTENPPGQADPYGDASVFDKSKEREKRLDAEEAEEEAAAKRKRRTTESVPDSSYEPATTWNGLEHVGGYDKQYWRDVWGPEHQFHGFMPKPYQVLKDNEAISVGVHRAIVETIAFRQAEIPYERMFEGDTIKDLTRNVQIVLATNGASVLEFPKSVSQEDIVQAITAAPDDLIESEAIEEAEEPEKDPAFLEETSTKENPKEAEEDVAADRSSDDPLKKSPARGKRAALRQHRAALASWNPAWLQVSLKDPAFKFAVLKRTLQLTGIHFPDAALIHTNDVQTLLSHLVKAPKPRKLNEALKAKKMLTKLPNVRVHQTRITSIDKEIVVGRWKVIKQELLERGLPVTGHGN